MSDEVFADVSTRWQAAYDRALGPHSRWTNVEGRVPTSPDFLCIGAQKSGTTWLYGNLPYHPLIWLPPIKELDFFNALHTTAARPAALQHRRKQVADARAWWMEDGRDAEKRATTLECLNLLDSDSLDDAWYRRVFSFRGPDQVGGDITPEYCGLPRDGVRHALALNPGMKAIAMVRDPADRALSHAKMLLGRNSTVATVSELLATDDYLALVNYSDYPRWLARWRGMLPSGNLHIEGLDHVIADPLGVLRRICGFLGLPFHPDFFSAARTPVFKGNPIAGEDELRATIRARMGTLYEDLGLVPGLLEALTPP